MPRQVTRAQRARVSRLCGLRSGGSTRSRLLRFPSEGGDTEVKFIKVGKIGGVKIRLSLRCSAVRGGGRCGTDRFGRDRVAENLFSAIVELYFFQVHLVFCRRLRAVPHLLAHAEFVAQEIDDLI